MNKESNSNVNRNSNSNSNSSTSFKIVTLGDSSSGKTCLINRWRFNEFDVKAPATIGAAFCVKSFENIKLQIWDTAGNERYSSLTPMYIRGSYIVFYCIDPSEQFEIKHHVDKIELIKDSGFLGESSDIFIIATKSDLNHTEVSIKRLKEFADHINASFYVTSSKTGENIEKLFEDASNKLKNKKNIKDENIILLDPNTTVKRACCILL